MYRLLAVAIAIEARGMFPHRSFQLQSMLNHLDA
jgi:hypothetical protein